MAKDTSFHDYVVHDLLGDIPGITSKAMFGGWGIFEKGIIFAIIVNAALYFKVGDSNRKTFEQLDSRPFTYSKRDGEAVTMSYWLVPEEVMENKEKLYDLMEQSVAVSRRQKS